jgi:hypothetical protein
MHHMCIHTIYILVSKVIWTVAVVQSQQTAAVVMVSVLVLAVLPVLVTVHSTSSAFMQSTRCMSTCAWH